jgi:hypothetical protein
MTVAIAITRRAAIMGMIGALVVGTLFACQPDDGSGQWKSAPATTQTAVR